MIDLRYLKKLIDMIDASSVDSVEITSEKGIKIRIAKSPAQRAGMSMAAPMPVPTVLAGPLVEPRNTPAAGVALTSVENAAPSSDGVARATPLLEVKSPMVGTFYGSPEPGAKPYVAVGDRVQKGMTLCIIEAMKIMNEIESEYAGVVKEIVVQDAQPVEYGQVLFRIDPNG
jgi:acetyl-CoA carboxylase biotin carboxyl carrier protein